MKTLVVVDVEADGPCPGIYSMVCFGAVVVERGTPRTFYGQTAPLTNAIYEPEALAISGFTREQHEAFPTAAFAMIQFQAWLKQLSQPTVFISDNLAFDWQFINYYFHACCNTNPFGWSGRRIGDIYGGFKQDIRAGWKQLRDTKHTHNPVDDAMGNVEALIKMADMGIKGILT